MVMQLKMNVLVDWLMNEYKKFGLFLHWEMKEMKFFYLFIWKKWDPFLFFFFFFFFFFWGKVIDSFCFILFKRNWVMRVALISML